MSVFRFKRFAVNNEKSAMKVNTDGVLLGACSAIPSDFVAPVRVLDIGTGTGTITLMLAQRLFDKGVAFMVDAIDIDKPSAEEASSNFSASPWADCLHAVHSSLSDFDGSVACREFYDLIVSNPPYFDDSLLNPDGRVSCARHTSQLTFADIAEFASRRLSDTGLISLVLPADRESYVGREMRSRGLFLTRIIRVSTSERKAPKRVIMEFAKARPAELADGTLIMHSPEYQDLVQDFYL